jgi:hypothetical protein
MACGCGGGSGSSGGALLTGTLSGGAVDDSSITGAPADTGIAAADVGGGLPGDLKILGSHSWWLLLALAIGVAWYLDSHKKGQD